jgi:hypothetical protein
MKAFKKVLVLVVALGALGYLFVRSLHSTRSEPYPMPASHLRGWTLALEAPGSPTGAVLSLRPPAALSPMLFKQVFERAMESLAAPGVAGMPLVLAHEFEQALAATATAERLLAMARESGLEREPLEAQCLAHRRVSEPGVTRFVYAASFRSAAYDRFRNTLAAVARERGGAASVFDPAAQSPLVIIGASDASFARWLPWRVREAECLAPLVAE